MSDPENVDALIAPIQVRLDALIEDTDGKWWKPNQLYEQSSWFTKVESKFVSAAPNDIEKLIAAVRDVQRVNDEQAATLAAVRKYIESGFFSVGLDERVEHSIGPETVAYVHAQGVLDLLDGSNDETEMEALTPSPVTPTAATLDPYPWRDNDGRKHSAFGPEDHPSMRGSYWSPDAGFSRDKADYGIGNTPNEGAGQL